MKNKGIIYKIKLLQIIISVNYNNFLFMNLNNYVGSAEFGGTNCYLNCQIKTNEFISK